MAGNVHELFINNDIHDLFKVIYVFIEMSLKLHAEGNLDISVPVATGQNHVHECNKCLFIVIISCF